MIGGLRLALRLAWRNARSHRVATALTALLVAVPVVALVASAVLVRSAQIPQSEQDRRTLGAADALLSQNSGSPQAPPLPAGSSVLSDSEDPAILTDGLRGQVTRRALDYDRPLAAGIIHQRAGRAPRSADEVVATTHLAERLHLSLGQVIHVRGQSTTLTIVGTVVDPNDVRATELIGPSGSLPASTSVSYLAAVPVADRSRIFGLEPAYSVQLRSSEMPGVSSSSLDRNKLNAGALVVVLALLEAALTAGTAFAVGARRSRRDLALVAVNGGDDSQVAVMVFANGIVCGVIGVISGVALGIGAGLTGLPLLQKHTSELLGGTRIEVKLVAAAALFGFVSSILACILPARLAARSSLRSALGGARGSTGTPRWVTVTGLGAAAVGVLSIARGAASAQDDRTTVVLFGVVLLEMGGVAVCPALIGLAGRLGGRLPALPRLALRDAARQRARTGPAVAAIAAAVSGAVAVSVYVASDNLHRSRIYVDTLPRNVLIISNASPVNIADLTSVMGAATARLAVPDRILRATAGPTNTQRNISTAGGYDIVTPANSGEVVTADVALLKQLGASAAAQAAFLAGQAVSGGLGPSGIPLTLRPFDDNAAQATNLRAVDAGWHSDSGKPALVVPTKLAQSLKLSPDEYEYRAPLDSRLSNSARQALESRAQDFGLYAHVNTGPIASDNVVSLALLGIAVVFSLIVTAAATALAAAESRSDMAILAAVGATGRVRRFFTAAQGSTTALLGAVLGIGIGVVPGIAVVHASLERLPLVLPWQPFVAFLVGLPLLAGLGGVLFSRSRLPKAPRAL